MEKDNHVVLGIHLQNRVKDAPEVQKVLTAYGCNIKTRIGLHEVSDNYCAGSGLILLEMVGDATKYKELAGTLNRFDGVEVQKMVFGHD
ncbi:hypothetical protein LPW11_21005 [Geomonas sp. RF6]|uniref:hypothetical protein n=1 Tax=Geomonas sp. RF6 TaxID=2897342 RepID=UPI001E476F02|nr:hypothetical protein [Geomonas sp. RF6]UFS70337.1 hypothetical protein LPW11_21005 [Geomonas sp. RF6]